jgi:hypothetical protein
LKQFLLFYRVLAKYTTAYVSCALHADPRTERYWAELNYTRTSVVLIKAYYLKPENECHFIYKLRLKMTMVGSLSTVLP